MIRSTDYSRSRIHSGAPPGHRDRASSRCRNHPDAKDPGDSSGEATPVPIPNTAVKLSSAEDTERAAFRENRSSPGFLRSRGAAGGALTPRRPGRPRPAILRRMTAVDPVARPVPPASGEARPARPFSGVCPYLAAVDGEWRSSTVAREHRCGAVAPPAPLAAEKQRRLCLTHDHVICATYDAARAARPVAHDRLPVLPRPIARTTPVVLDHGRIAIDMPAFRSDRPVWQAILIGILAIAFAAIVLTRVTDGGTSGGATGASHGPGQSVTASAAATGATASQGTATAGPSGAWIPRRAAARRRVPRIQARRLRRRGPTRSRPATRWSGSPPSSGRRPRPSPRSTGSPIRRACTRGRSSRSPDPGAGQRWQPRQ